MDPKLAAVDSMIGDDPKEWWQLAYVAQFCYAFRPAFSFPDFMVEDLEEALSTPGLNGSPEWKLICDIHVRFLRGITPNRGVNAENWQEHLRKLMRGKAKRSKAEAIPDAGKEESAGNSPAENSSENSSDSNAENGELEMDAVTPENDEGSAESQLNEQSDVGAPWNPLGVDTDYRTIALRDKVAILFLLSEMRLDANDVYDALKGWDGDYLRLQPAGTDRHHNRYWFMDSGMRLYKEAAPKVDVTPDESEDEKPKKVKPSPAKTKKGKRGPGRPKKEPVTPVVDKTYTRGKRNSFRHAVSKMRGNHSTCPSESEAEESEVEDVKEEDPRAHPDCLLSTSLFGAWSVVADTEEEWDDFIGRMSRSRNADERNLGKFLRSEIVEEVTKKRQLREKQREKLEKRLYLESLPRRASDRITIMKVTREEEEKQAEARREMREAEKRHAEEEKQKRQADLRREMREKRRQQRAEVASAQGVSMSEPDDQRPGPPSGISEDKYDAMYATLEALRRNANAWLFEEPVSDEVAPNYSLIIKRPMNLSRVEMKLDEYAYARPGEFVEDLRVMCGNCRLYNGPKSPYYKMAEHIEATLKRQVVKHFPRVEWGEPPELPPSDPLPFVPIPKPVKRKSTAEDSISSPPSKVKAPLSGTPSLGGALVRHPMPQQPKSEGAFTALAATQVPRQQHPVASPVRKPKDITRIGSHPYPPYAATSQPLSPPSAMPHAHSLAAGVHGVPQPGMTSRNLGAWGAALAPNYGHPVQNIQQQLPSATRPLRFQHPASTSNWGNAGSVASPAPLPPHCPSAIPHQQMTQQPHLVNGSIKMESSAVQKRPSAVDGVPAAASSPVLASSSRTLAPASMPRVPPDAVGISAFSTHRPVADPAATSVGNSSIRPPSVPGMSALRQASRPLSSGPISLPRPPGKSVVSPVTNCLEGPVVARPMANPVPVSSEVSSCVSNKAPQAMVSAPLSMPKSASPPKVCHSNSNGSSTFHPQQSSSSMPVVVANRSTPVQLSNGSSSLPAQVQTSQPAVATASSTVWSPATAVEASALLQLSQTRSDTSNRTGELPTVGTSCTPGAELPSSCKSARPPGNSTPQIAPVSSPATVFTVGASPVGITAASANDSVPLPEVSRFTPTPVEPVPVTSNSQVTPVEPAASQSRLVPVEPLPTSSPLMLAPTEPVPAVSLSTAIVNAGTPMVNAVNSSS